MPDWWTPNRAIGIGMPAAPVVGLAAGGLANIWWGALAGVVWGLAVAIAGILIVTALAYSIRAPLPTSNRAALPESSSAAGEAEVLEGGDLNPIHPRGGDPGLRLAPSPEPTGPSNKCTWCGHEWRESDPAQCPNCLTPTPRWRVESDPNRIIGFGNEYLIRSFQTLDGRVILGLSWPESRGGGPNLPVEEFLLAQIREEAEKLGLKLPDLVDAYTISFVRDGKGAVRIRELRRNPYRKN
jgi:hypothetical protein